MPILPESKYFTFVTEIFRNKLDNKNIPGDTKTNFYFLSKLIKTILNAGDFFGQKMTSERQHVKGRCYNK